MDNEKVIYRERKFLNKKSYHAGAYIIVEIIRWVSAYKTKKDQNPIPTVSYDYTLDIADCSRIISLDFSTKNKKNYDNTIYKLDLLINILTKFKKTIVNNDEEDQKLIDKGKLKRDKY